MYVNLLGIVGSMYVDILGTLIITIVEIVVFYGYIYGSFKDCQDYVRWSFKDYVPGSF